MDTSDIQHSAKMSLYKRLTWALAILINGLILLSVLLPKTAAPAILPTNLLPPLNAILNGLTFLALLTALIAITQKNTLLHRRFIGLAFAATSVFLVSYLAYHFTTPSVRYGGTTLLRYCYYPILISHIFLAILIVPLAIYTAALALKGDNQRHRRLARWTMPIWLYVSLTGVIVYLMIAPYYPH